MRRLLAALLASVAIAACGPSTGSPAGGTDAPQATARPQPANASATPAPSKGEMGDYDYGY